MIKPFSSWDEDELRQAMMRDKAATGMKLPKNNDMQGCSTEEWRAAAWDLRHRILDVIRKIEPCQHAEIMGHIPGLTKTRLTNHLSVMHEKGMIGHPEGGPRKWVAK